MPTVPENVISRWATDQSKLLSDDQYQKTDLIVAAHIIHQLGGDPSQLPFCYCGSRFLNRQELYGRISSQKEIHLPMHKSYSDKFEFISIQDLRAPYFTLSMHPAVVVLEPKGSSNALISSEVGREVDKNYPYQLSQDQLESSLEDFEVGLILPFLKNTWQGEPKMTLQKIQLFSNALVYPPVERWVLTLSADKVKL